MLTADYERNIGKNGIEIRFSEKPPANIRSDLLAKKWKYSYRYNMWYIYYTDSNLAYARTLCSKINDKNKPKPYQPYAGSNPFSSISSRESRYYWPSHHTASQPSVEMSTWYGRAQEEPLGQYKPISPKDVRYQKKRSFFS